MLPFSLRKTRLFSQLVLASPLFITPLAAQGVSTQLSGQVLDGAGQVLSGAEVTLRSLETGLVRRAQSDAKGRYVLRMLPVGGYALTVTKAQFQTVTVNVTLNLGDSAPLQIKLPALAGATVEVVSERAVLESERSASASYLGTQDMEKLPMLGRRWDNYALLTPQVTVSGRKDLAIAGQRGVNTSIQVDGAGYNSTFFGGTLGQDANGSPYTLSSEAIREFQVITGGASAEFGRMGGGYLNAITKSGSNDFTGALFYYERPQSLVATSHSTRKEVVDFTNRQFGFSAGGPIIKDKLFYFVCADFQRDEQPITFAWGPSLSKPLTLDPQNPADRVLLARGKDYTQKNDANTFMARLDFLPSTDHSLQLRINRSSFEGDYGTGFNIAFDGTSLEKGKTLSLVGQWNWVIDGNWMSEWRINRLVEELPRAARSGHPAVRMGSSPVLGQYGQSFFNREFEASVTQISEILTYATPDFQIRAGMDMSFHKVDETFAAYRGGLYQFDGGLDAFRKGEWNYYQQFFSFQRTMTAAEAGTMSTSEKDLAAFIQGDWRINSEWKVGLGLRMDRQEHPDFGIADFNTGNFLTFSRPGALTAQIPDDTTFSPRLSAVWTPHWDQGRTVIRASAGLYVSRTPNVFLYQVYTANGLRSGTVRINAKTQTDIAAIAAVYPEFARSGTFAWGNPFHLPEQAYVDHPELFTVSAPDIQTFDPDFKNPRTKSYTLEGERAFLPGLTAGLNLTFSKTDHLQRIRDLNLAYTTPNAQGRPIYGKRPNINYRTMQAYVSDARSEYQAMTLSVRYDKSDSWIQGQLAYTYAKNKDNDSNERNFNNYPTQDTNRLEDDYSWSFNDRRNVVTGFISLKDQWYTQVVASFVCRYQSGLPYNPVFQNPRLDPPLKTLPSDLNNDGMNNDRTLGVARNAYREAGVTAVDLKLSRTFSWATRYHLTLNAEVSNLFNHAVRYAKATHVEGTDADPVLKYAPMTLSTERRVQLGARFAF